MIKNRKVATGLCQNGLIALIIILLAAFFISCSNQGSTGGTASYTTNSYIKIADFDTATLPSFQVNSRGQVAWTACSDDGSDLYLYENGLTTQITNNMKHCLSPRINNEGQIVWYEFSGKSSNTFNVYFYKDGNITQIQGPEGVTDAFPRQNGNGSIVWERKEDVEDGQIYLYSNGSTEQITKSGNNVEPQVNDRGQITWYGSEAGKVTINYYDNGAIKQLNSKPVDYFAEYDEETHYLRRINSNGDVVWVGREDEKTGIFLYRNGVTTKISTVEQNKNPWINDNGQVVWEGYDGSHGQIYFYNGTQVVQLTDSSFDNASPAINNKGQIVWQGGSHIYIYDNSRTIQLSDNNMENVFPQISENGHVVWLAKEWKDDRWYFRNVCLVTPQTGENNSKDKKGLNTSLFTLKKETMDPGGDSGKSSKTAKKPVKKIQRNKPDEDKFSFIVLGDSRGEDYSWIAGEKLNKKFLQFFATDIINKHNPDFVVFIGDCCTNAHTVTGHENLKDWKEYMQPIYQKGTPLYMSKGNHELYNWCAAFREKFQEEFTDTFFTDQPDNGPDGYKKLCYSFTWGNSFFIVFDTFYCWKAPWWHINDYHYYGNIDDPQLNWIKEQNKTDEAKNATHRFILSHAPAYGTEGEQVFDKMKKLWQEIDDNNYDLYFGAHEHLYSRKTIDSSIGSTYKNKIPQIIAGAAGAPVDPKWRVKVDMGKWKIHLCYHYVLVEVSGDSVSTKAFKVYKDSSGNFQVEDTPFDTYQN